MFNINMPDLAEEFKMKTVIKIVSGKELAGIFGLSLLAISLFLLSISKGYLAEGYAGIIVFLFIMLFYNRMGRTNKNIIATGKSDLKILRQFNANRLFSYNLSLWAVSLLFFGGVYIKAINSFPIEIYFSLIIILFTIFFGESVNIYINCFSENKLPIGVGICSAIYILGHQTLQIISIAILIIAITLIANKSLNRIFNHNIRTYNNLILNIVNNVQSRKIGALLVIGIAIAYCYLSNIEMDSWKVLFETMILSIMAIFIYEYTFSKNIPYTNAGEYFLKKSGHYKPKRITKKEPFIQQIKGTEYACTCIGSECETIRCEKLCEKHSDQILKEQSIFPYGAPIGRIKI